MRMAVGEVQGSTAGPSAPATGARWRRVVLGLVLAGLGLGAGVAVGYGLGQRRPLVGQALAPAAQPPAPAVAAVPVAVVPVAPAPLASAAAASAPEGVAPAAPVAHSEPPPPAQADAVRPAAAVPLPEPHAAEQRYALLAPALREAVVHTRAVFDDPAQEFWVLQIGLSSSAVGALRLLKLAQQTNAEVWVQDRIYYPGTQNQAAPVWAVYAGRYATRAQAVQKLQEWPASLKTNKPLPRSLVRLRAETYPERVPS